MAKAMYSVVGGTTKKVKKAYCVVGGVTKKIKKIYAVVGGVTKLVWSGQGQISYYGTATALIQKSQCLAGASNPNYAIFAGGWTSASTGQSTVEAYNTSLTQSTCTGLTKGRGYISEGSIGNYAIFAGGYLDGTKYSYVDAYDTSLTKSTPTSLGDKGYKNPSASISSYAMFRYSVNSLDAYNTSLTKTTVDLTDTTRNNVSGGAVAKKYALFVDTLNSTNNIVSLNESLTKNLLSINMSMPNSNASSVSTENYCLFISETIPNSTCAINKSLTLSSAASLSVGRIDFAKTSVDNYAIFAGGSTSTQDKNSYLSGIVDFYDASLTKGIAANLSVDRKHLAGASIGNYALFAGGWGPVYSTVVDVYQSK